MHLRNIEIIVITAKCFAIAALLVTAPMSWLPLLSSSLAPVGAPPSSAVAAEYVVAYALTILSVCIVPFLSSTALRIMLSVVMLAPVAFDQAIQRLSGAHVNQDLINLIWQVRYDAADGASYFPEVAGAIAWVALLGLIFALPPRELKARRSFAIVPVLALGVTSHNAAVADGGKITQPPVFALAGQVWVAAREADPQTKPALETGYLGDITPRIQNIVFIVDESVTGNFLSLNNEGLDNTPFLESLKDKDYFQNFGLASSISNCSVATRLALRSGARRSSLPDRAKASLTAPNFWLFAKAAGYITHYIDAFRTNLTYHSFMGPLEAEQIDQRIALGAEGAMDTKDHAIARHILGLLNSPGRHFIYVEKLGTHYPHSGRELPENYPYQPLLAGSLIKDVEPKDDRHLQVINYLKALHWQVDEFFRILEPILKRPDTLVIYTSDHGQNMFDMPSRYFHCNPRDPALNEATVPLFVATGNSGLMREFRAGAAARFNRSSHFEIFPTLIDLMGYDRTYANRHFGPALLGAAPVAPRRFLGQKLFSGRSFAFDHGLLAADDDLQASPWFSFPDRAPRVHSFKNQQATPPFCKFEVRLSEGQNFALRVAKSVDIGDEVEAGIWLWADTREMVKLTVARQGNTPGESSSISLTLSSEPTFYSLKHIFRASHAGWRLQVSNSSANETRFYACQAVGAASSQVRMMGGPAAPEAR